MKIEVITIKDNETIMTKKHNRINPYWVLMPWKVTLIPWNFKLMIVKKKKTSK